jgi:alpha-mannosidase
MTIDSSDVAVKALKRSEDGGEWVLRLQETDGSHARTTLRIASGIGSAREIDGRERNRGKSQVENGDLHTRLRPFQPRSFALRIKPPDKRIPPLSTQAVSLDHDTVAVSFHSQKHGADFDGRGQSIPGELLPPEIMSGEIPFRLQSSGPGAPNSLTSAGQEIALPEGKFDTAFLLATAAADEDRMTALGAGEIDVAWRVNSWSRPIGQWRRQRRIFGRSWGPPEAGYVTRADIAWVGTHRHDRRVRDQAYTFCYLFRYALPLPSGCSSLRLPDDATVKLFAVTLAQIGTGRLVPAADLF